MIQPNRVSKDEIREIWDAHELEDVKRVLSAASGSRNECYIVNEAFVIRFNTRDPHFAKFRNERLAYDLLAKSAVPVPTVIVLDESRSIVPYDFIIVTRLPGVNVAESRDGLNRAQVRELAREAGGSLALLHEITFEGFGKLSDLKGQPFVSWPDYFRDYAQRYVQPAQEYDLVEGTTLSRLRGVLDRAQDLLSQVTQGVSVHSDFHYENILQKRGRLSGILDFEWALSGDPSADFVTADVREEMLPGGEAAFVEGYLSTRPLDEWHSRRVEIYRLFLQLETAVMCKRQGDGKGVQSALASMLLGATQLS